MHGKIDIKITLHYRTGGTHRLRDSAVQFMLLDEKGDQVRSPMPVIRSQISTELELNGTDPEYAPELVLNTQPSRAPLIIGARYQLVVVAQGPGIVPMANVKSFKLVE